MTDAVVVATARTGLAKSWRGAFNMTHGATMGGHAVQHAIARAKLAPEEVDDVLIGCALPEGATGANIARQIALRAGCPVTVPAATVNRFCSSGLQTIALAAQRVIVGEADAIVAGGVESISCVQNEQNQHMRRDPWLVAHKPEVYWTMLETAETVAARYHIARERQDEYGVQSQQRASAAGKFADEIVERCVYALVNEGAKILEEGIALRASDVDIVYLTGYGFPLWRGGPMLYADMTGLYGVIRRMHAFAAMPGADAAFWTPAPLLARLAAEGGSFNG